MTQTNLIVAVPRVGTAGSHFDLTTIPHSLSEGHREVNRIFLGLYAELKRRALIGIRLRQSCTEDRRTDLTGRQDAILIGRAVNTADGFYHYLCIGHFYEACGSGFTLIDRYAGLLYTIEEHRQARCFLTYGQRQDVLLIRQLIGLLLRSGDRYFADAHTGQCTILGIIIHDAGRADLDRRIIDIIHRQHSYLVQLNLRLIQHEDRRTFRCPMGGEFRIRGSRIGIANVSCPHITVVPTVKQHTFARHLRQHYGSRIPLSEQTDRAVMRRNRRRCTQRLLVRIHHVSRCALCPTGKLCRSSSLGLCALTLIGIIGDGELTLESVSVDILRRTIDETLVRHRSARSTITIEREGVRITDKSSRYSFLSSTGTTRK